MPRRRNETIAVLACLALAGSLQAGVEDAVVLVDGCSGVCVDEAGLVMTARHCDLPKTVTVRFKDWTVSAKRIYVCPETEGPVIYDCEGNGYPFLPVAASPPQIGERLWSYGYPQVNGQRELRWASGRLLRWSTFEYAGGSFNGNVLGFGTGQGWSGGPLLNAKAEVCGLLNSADCATSVFISSAAVRQAYAAVQQHIQQDEPVTADPPTLYVFGSVTCGPCRRFKDDFTKNPVFRQQLENRFAIEFVDVDQQPAMAERFGVNEVPQFIVPDTVRIIGYEGTDRLLVQLRIQQEISERPRSDPISDQTEVDNAIPEVVSRDAAPVTKEPTSPQPHADTSSNAEVPESAPAPDSNDRLDHVAGLVEKAVTVATWLGVTGATGGAAGLVLGGIALWRTMRRRRQRPARDPPATKTASNKPPVVTVDSPPPPQAIIPETRFAPYERDTFAEAFAWAEAEMARKYPGSVGTMESIKGLIDQFLSGRGVKRES